MGLFSNKRLRSCCLWLFGTKRIRLEISVYKRPSYLESAKIEVVKMIFHVLFLVLETIERRKYNKLPTLSFNSFPLEVWWGFLMIECQGAVIFGCLVQR